MDIPAWPQPTKREAQLLQTVLNSTQWGGFHPYIADFETQFAAYQHSDYGISTFNGTVSLELALIVLGIKPGDEVIVPSISFVSSATAISRIGAIPVFVDIGAWSFNVDPDSVRDAISPKTKAVMAVHFGGVPCNLEAILEICREHQLHLIEDAAHAHGSEWRGKRAGSFGIVGSFSFQNGKALCSGEGGLLTTSDEDIAEHARSIGNQGRLAGKSFYEHYRLGTNLRMTAFQAAVLLAQLESLPSQIAHRSRMADLLKNLLEDIPELVWQETPAQMTQTSWYLMPARIRSGLSPSRDEFISAMRAASIPCTPFYPHPLYRNPLYQLGANCRVMPCLNAEAYVHDAFWFPHRLLLSDADTIHEISRTIHRCFRRESSAAG